MSAADSSIMSPQQTLAIPFAFEGIGIHTGRQTRVEVRPADVDTGRVFYVNGQAIPARAEWVVDTRRCTTLGRDDVRLHTVEHLLSALAAYHVDNAAIHVEGTEIPILDGSALPHAQAIEQSGIIAQGKPARALTITKALEWAERGSEMRAVPSDVFAVETQVEFADWPEGRAVQTFREKTDSSRHYLETVAPARTFAFRQEVEQLLAAGLARGGSLDNALIVTPPSTFSTLLRLPAEWCAHKLLDVIGDMALLDARPLFELTAIRPGHGGNVSFARLLLENSIVV